MIDTHLHILPGIDDGPATLQESLSLAQTLVQEGVRAAIATPHYNDEFPRLSAAEIQSRVYDLQQQLDHYRIPLCLFAGHEALIKPGLVEDIQTGRLATLNGSRYVLLELWNSAWLPETERVIFELRAHGFIPVLAHPERQCTFQKDPERLAVLQKQGALAQLTASSLVGLQGKTARACAETLLRKELIQCIASDAHGLHRRPATLVESLQRARKLLGDERIYQMTEMWPTIILKNEIHPRSSKSTNAPKS